ncbi:hypothetical protein RchiOBHm_Chr6g0255861 [Rosa chinensis]|uniref:Uncharacterized protein n=1 Tax=Rosa chinensis TaxID=74649 RepID=A0A2P6PLZ1_ROSCH|nr:hypothetical protein RchiOBHm_Chr6g0255861 [Rosa chinensis]
MNGMIQSVGYFSALAAFIIICYLIMNVRCLVLFLSSLSRWKLNSSSYSIMSFCNRDIMETHQRHFFVGRSVIVCNA